jgi:glycosyltransferase involved in cell wall biosynthesis
VLIISPFPLLPAVHGGRVRTLGLGRGMARAGASVDVLAPWTPGAPRTALLEPRLRLHTHRMVANLLPMLIPKRIAPALALLSLEPRSRFGPRRWLARFGTSDIVQFEFCAQSHWAALLPRSAAVAYSAHNVELEYHRIDPEPQLFRHPALRRIERLERTAVQSSDLVIACSDEDVQALAALYRPPRRHTVIANGFDAALFTLDRAALRNEARAALGFGSSDRVILFLGGDAAHNREAVRFLASDVLPALGPAARLLILGRSGAAAPRGHPQIRQLGFVEDCRTCFAAADVAVNPVAFGSGTNIKLGEYAAAGLPSISTPIGLRGLPHLASMVRSVPRERFAEVLRASLPEPPRDREALQAWTWDALGHSLVERYWDLRAEVAETLRPNP